MSIKNSFSGVLSIINNIFFCWFFWPFLSQSVQSINNPEQRNRLCKINQKRVTKMPSVINLLQNWNFVWPIYKHQINTTTNVDYVSYQCEKCCESEIVNKVFLFWPVNAFYIEQNASETHKPMKWQPMKWCRMPNWKRKQRCCWINCVTKWSDYATTDQKAITHIFYELVFAKCKPNCINKQTAKIQWNPRIQVLPFWQPESNFNNFFNCKTI